jgi:hypothetical protein
MRSTGLFAGIHLAGNAFLLWLGYTWLGLGESRAGTLMGSMAVAVAIVCMACCLHGASFPFFAERRVAAAFGSALRRLPALIVAAMAVLVIYVLLSRAADAMDKPGFTLASWLTLKLRKPVKPATVQRVFHAVFWVIRWIAIPVVVLPMVSAIVSRGWRGFGAFGARCRSLLYWVEAPVLLLLAVWAPLKLIAWVPHMKSFQMEMTSFVVRAAVAYLLFVAGWLGLAWVTSGGKPRLVQSSTVPSP